MKKFRLLWECIKSDQLSYAQIVEHLKDIEFKKWLIKNNLIKG